MKVLGIDTSLRSTGFGVVESKGSSLSAIEYGRIRIPATRPLSACLRQLHEGISELLDRHALSAVAIEGVFFSRNAKTALILGEARGSVIAVCASRGLSIYEYAPRRVKQAVVGFGNADKEQVRHMVMTLLALEEEPQEDAGDALAVAICHLHGSAGHEALRPKAI